MNTATLLVSCGDRTGIVAALSDFVFRHGGNIIDADQHSEDSGHFFMRLRFETSDFALDWEGIQMALAVLARGFDMQWQLYGPSRPRVALFCSKGLHCVYDLLMRQQMNELAGDIVAVVSNHENAREACEHFGLPFHHIPVGIDKGAAEAQQRALLSELNIDLVVLARYMQVLSPAFVDEWSGRAINIHHSFLPAFAGAKPYHQAKQRGVKVIGATAHYVTADLDQGPIIDQDVIRVTHRDEVSDLVRKGRDIERQVLAHAVTLHLQRRVLVHANRTIVFH
ncbi:MAG: formyltetrahydrofolate deformylase [Planctomycetota bacterium]|jgi:formyltetrahydrofolate deformylase|nr:formyltetrahydrofolate deformylase [Planctomycetota bacterium]